MIMENFVSNDAELNLIENNSEITLWRESGVGEHELHA